MLDERVAVERLIAAHARDAEEARMFAAMLGLLTATRRPRKLKPCGTAAAYQRHLYHGEPPCQACRKAASAYHREWSRERRSTRPPRRLKPCGTAAAYHRHRRRGEEPCHACRKAVAAYQRRRYRDKTRRAGAVLRAA